MKHPSLLNIHSTKLFQMPKSVIVFIIAMLFTACTSAPLHDSGTPSVPITKRVDMNDSPRIKQILNQQYKDWRHVQHRMGGTSRKGVDCSGLVYLTYRTKFGIDLPRDTEHQSETGRSIRRNQLRAGDLVFFKTGIFTRHVGMYIDSGNFLHASSSNGVVISNLHEPYWADAYWKAKRIQ